MVCVIIVIYILQMNCRNQAEIEYNELKKRVEALQTIIEQERKNPTSEYDESIEKQHQFNDTLRAQVLFFHLIILNFIQLYGKLIIRLIIVTYRLLTQKTNSRIYRNR